MRPFFALPWLMLAAWLLVGAAAQAAPPGPAQAWQQTFDDEFDGTRLEPHKWSTGYGWGAVTNWSGEYCDPANVRVAGGQCHIRVENRAQHDRPYTSGAINTKGKFSQQYGYFEARIKAAKGQGLLNAFWGKRADESWPPEIDVVEVLGKIPTAVGLTVHYGATNQQASAIYPPLKAPGAFDACANFHIYGVLWTPTENIFYVDGVERFRTQSGAASINGPFYWMLNVHVGNDAHNWLGQPDASVQWPATMSMDWVRAWKRKGGS